MVIGCHGDNDIAYLPPLIQVVAVPVFAGYLLLHV